MNINKLRNAVIQGMISTITAQNCVWSIYDDRTDENTKAVRDENDTQIDDLELLFK